MNKNSEAILIFCCNLCIGEGVLPFRPAEWKRLAKKLLEKNLEPSDLLAMTEDDMEKQLDCDKESIERIKNLRGRSASLFIELEKYTRIGISVVTRADEDYPPLLRKKLGESCPPFFFYAGDIRLARKHSIGFEGSRFLDESDIEFEESIVRKVVSSIFCVVSGGANGADSVAEDYALANGGKVIEFSANAMTSRLRLSKVIKSVQSGNMLLLSSVNPDAGFTVGNAMARNRFICAQSDAVIAIKSINKGGTWSGVIDNLKHGFCPVFCWKNDKYPENLELIELGAIVLTADWQVSEIENHKVTPSQKTESKFLQMALI